MRFGSPSKIESFCRALVASAALLAACGAAVAQVPTPTPEQIKAFQSLPPDQRDALLQQLGVGTGGTSTGGTARSGSLPGVAGAGQSSEVTVRQNGLNTNPLNGDLARALAEREPKIKGGEVVLLQLEANTAAAKPGDPPPPEELRERVMARNPYELSSSGILQLPGFRPILLAGLTQKEAQSRVAADPALRSFFVTLTVLRLDPQGASALKPFGYDMFRAGASAFVPGTDIPAPADYKLGSGDVLDVQLYGQQSRSYSLPVGRDGYVSMPDLGPVSVGGQSYAAVQSLLGKRVKQQMVGTEARISLSELRSQRVLVVGDAEKPGSYVVSGMATVTNALFASSGVKPIGSLRRIEVKRAGHLIRRLDLYAVLLNGDTSNDVTLQTGDVVLVPPVGVTVGVDGEVRRPAIYELAAEKTVGEVIALAGGLTPEADSSVVTIDRIGPKGDRAAVACDLSTPQGRSFPVQAGDIVRIAAVRPVVDNGIVLEGRVVHPGTYAWREGLRISDVLRSVDDLEPKADQHYLLIRRETPSTRRVVGVSADLDAALAQRGSSVDLLLQPRDRITVFDLVSPRDRVVGPLLTELQRQSTPDSPAGVVTVDGRVNAPGSYPLEPAMRISDLLRAGGGLQDSAYGVGAELTRYTVGEGDSRRAEIQKVDLAAVRRGDAAADIALQPYDALSIKTTPEWERVEHVELVGEVRFPGDYQIRRGETLRSVIARAGGLTSLAFSRGAVFTREELKLRERDQLDRLATRLQTDLAVLSLQASQTSPGTAQAVSSGQELLDQLRQTKPVGRLVIDLDSVLSDASGHDADVTLRNGDRLVVPRATEEVSVLGEVQNPTSHLYQRGLKRDNLIALSGGTTSRADRRRTYVVRANGSVVAGTGRWIGSGNVEVRPGDTVVVPPDAERMRPLPMWTAITTIIYNLAIAAAAIGHL